MPLFLTEYVAINPRVCSCLSVRPSVHGSVLALNMLIFMFSGSSSVKVDILFACWPNFIRGKQRGKSLPTYPTFFSMLGEPHYFFFCLISLDTHMPNFQKIGTTVAVIVLLFFRSKCRALRHQLCLLA